MKVLMIARPNLFKLPGGDTVQIEQTAMHLRKLDVQVNILVDNGSIDYSSYDLIHFFNMMDPEDILGHVYKTDVPFILSTVYINYREYDRYHRQDAFGLLSRIFSADQMEYLKTIAKYVFKNERISTFKYFVKGHSRSVKYILNKASCLLPNSENEYHRVVNDYGIMKKHFVIPNAIQPDVFVPDQNTERDLVICVGRIEGRKNQLNLIRAMNKTELPVVIIGYESDNQIRYVAQCRAEAQKNIHFTSRVDDATLMEYYQRARVHVLPSWFETTGLSTLEAGAMGCNIVVGDRGDVREYVEGYAEFCDPGDIDSIKDAVVNAYNKPLNVNLRKHILEKYTWDKTAKLTLEAYHWVLNGNV